MVRKIEKNLYHLAKAGHSVLVTPTIDVVTGQVIEAKSGSSSEKEWIKWGTNDNESVEMLRLIWNSPTKPRLMDQAKEFILGADVKLLSVDVTEEGKEVKKLIKDVDLSTWFRKKKIFSKYLELAALSLAFAEMAFVRISIQDNGEVELETIQPTKVRFLKPSNGQPLTHVLISPKFGTGSTPDKNTIPKVPIFDLENPTANPESIMILKKAQIGSDFYTQGLWWGTKTWTKVDNMTPEYHLSGLINGYNLKLLIEIDESYFLMDHEDLNDEETLKIVEDRKETFMSKMDDYLSGVKNAEKALVLIGNLMGDAGKERRLIKVTPIENKMTDDAYMNLIKQAGMKQAQGHGILPSLAGIAEGDKLGGSGSELMHSVMFQIRYMTPSYRRLLKEPLDAAMEIMGYDLDEYSYHFTDIEMTTLDENPTGKQAISTNIG